MKKILSLAIFAIAAYNIQAQTQTYSNTDPKTGVKVTTKITPLQPENAQVETLETQIANLELLHRNASPNPDLVANGTVAKYAQALADKRAELAAKSPKTNVLHKHPPMVKPNIKNTQIKKRQVPIEKSQK